VATENPSFIFSPGTQVVARVEIKGVDGRPLHPLGAVGIIVSSPADHRHAYRVRFPDGFEASLTRFELMSLRDFQADSVGFGGGGKSGLDEFKLRDYVIFQCVIGSQAYGLNEEGSDTDRRGIYLPPARMHWSLYGVPEQIEQKETEECYWELQKFITLGLKANPNVLECLYSPIVEVATPLAQELLDMRHLFLSKLVYQTYNGYVMSQFKKLGQDLRNKGEVKWKHVMHLIRLLLAGITVLKEGTVPVRAEANRDKLLAIRRGEIPWDTIDMWRLELHQEFDAALTTTPLPDRPDYERVNAFLIKARQARAREMES
jgi:uncharacterized protein